MSRMDLKRVNHGAPVEVVDWTTPPAKGCTFRHQGEDGHDLLAADEQCECGVLGIGIVR